MNAITLKQINRVYANNGQHAEQTARFNLTNEIVKADNKPAEQCADCLDIQIKSARATVCKGTDLQKYLANDKANRYGYVTKDFKTMYIMTKAEWFEFVTIFASVTRESKKNGGAEKLKLRTESKAMMEWLGKRA